MSKNNYSRGEIYLVEEYSNQGGEIRKTRPWILVGATQINQARSTVLAVPLSTQVKAIPHLSIKVLVNNNYVCAILDQVRALDKRRLIRFEGVIAMHEMSLIEDGLKYVLCL